MELMKILEVGNQSISKSKTIISGHHYSTEMLASDDKITAYEDLVREEKDLLFGQSEESTNEVTDENSNKCTLMSLNKIA